MMGSDSTSSTVLADERAVAITFLSGGERVAGLFYPAEGEGLIPTAILAHGFPVNHLSPLGLGPVLMYAGINAMSFNYRGTWGSEGLYSPNNAVDDIFAAVDFILSDAVADHYHIDSARLALIGYSFGGATALISALNLPHVRKLAYIAGVLLSVIGRQCEANESFRKAIVGRWQHDIDSSGTRSLGAESCVTDMMLKPEEDDPLKNAHKLVDKDLLLIGGWLDDVCPVETHLLPLYRALQRAGAAKLGIEVYEADHRFEQGIEDLQKRIIAWVKA